MVLEARDTSKGSFQDDRAGFGTSHLRVTLSFLVPKISEDNLMTPMKMIVKGFM